MPDTAYRRRLRVVIPILSLVVVAAFSLAGYSFYSAHRSSCASRNTTLNVLHDLIVIAEVPPPKTHLTKQQKDNRDAFNARVFRRIDKARC